MSKYTSNEIEAMIAELQSQLVEQRKTQQNIDKYDRTDKIRCDICGGRYIKSNAAVHRRTKKHMNEVEHINELRRLVKSKNLEGRT